MKHLTNRLTMLGQTVSASAKTVSQTSRSHWTLCLLTLFISLFANVGEAWGASSSYIPTSTKTINASVIYYTVSGNSDIATGKTAGWITIPAEDYNDKGVNDFSGTPQGTKSCLQVKVDGNVYNSNKRVIHFRVTGITGVMACGSASSGRGFQIGATEYIEGTTNEDTNMEIVAGSTQALNPVSYSGLDKNKTYIISVLAYSSDTYLYAVKFLTENLYALSYELNGHGEAIPSATVSNLPNPLPAPTASGYTFMGWYTDNSLTVSATAGAQIDANTTLYAKWLSSTCEITSVTYTKDANTIYGIKDGDASYTITIPYGDAGNSGDGKFNIGFAHNGASTSLSSPQKKSLGTTENSTNNFKPIITAEDGTTQKTWTIKLVRGLQPTSDLAVSSENTTALINQTDYETDISVTSSSNGAYTVTSNKVSVISSAYVNNGKLYITTGTGTGMCSVKIAQAADGIYPAGEKTVTIIVGRPQHATPTISFANNTVTITSTNGSKIYYTTDGNTPTESSALYSGPFAVSSDCIVKAFATANNYDPSSVVSEDVIFSIQPLSVAWNVSTTAEYHTGDELSSNADIVSVKLGGVDNWSYDDSRKGIYNQSQGGYPDGGHLVITPKVDLNFSLSSYASLQNVNLRLRDAETGVIVKDFREKNAVTNDFGTLKAGKTYYIIGESFKGAPGGYDFIFFKSFTATTAPMTYASTGEGKLTVTYSNKEEVSSGSYIGKGEKIMLNCIPAPTYTYIVTVKKIADDEDVTAAVLNENIVTMPDYAINVNVEFVKHCDNHTIYAGSTIGSTSENNGWWRAFSNFYELRDGQAREFTFTNYSQGDKQWHNWVLVASNMQAHNGDTGFTNGQNGFKEYFAERSDIFNAQGSGLGEIEMKLNGASDHTIINWETYEADMQAGADVSVKVAFKNGMFYMYAKTVAKSGNEYYMVMDKDLEESTPIYLCFTPNEAYLTDFYAKPIQTAYSVSANQDPQDKGGVTIMNEDGIVIKSGAYINAGEKIIFTATPTDGTYNMYKWEANDGVEGNADGVTYTIDALATNSALTAKYTEETIAFENGYVEVDVNTSGVGSYWQALSQKPEDAVISYKIIYPDAANYPQYQPAISKAEVTEDNNGNGLWNVSLFGTGYVIVVAESGALTAQYVIKAKGFAFANASIIYDYDNPTSYIQTIADYPGTRYRIAEYTNSTGTHKEQYGALKICDLTVNENTGVISGLPSKSNNKGGAVVIEAYDGTHSAIYTLTVPYTKHIWNFYKEDPVEKQDDAWNDAYSDTYPLVYGHMVNGINPHAASQVPLSPNLDGVNYIVPVDNSAKNKLENGLKQRKTWQDAQKTATVNDAEYYWNYTFKTMTFTADRKNITYVNEPLFSYKEAVNGNNACVVPNTAGLVFNCAADKFGINDSNTDNVTMNGDAVFYTAQNNREMDRAILIKGNSTLTIPALKAGTYVKLHWYRHSTNSGDQFSVTNARDLDGTIINPNDVLRFTGSAYYRGSISAYKGCTFLQSTGGDMVITFANKNWSELYRIEITDEFETDLQVMYGKVSVGTDPKYLDDDNEWGGNSCSGTSLDWMKNMDTEDICIVRNANNNDVLTNKDICRTAYLDKGKTTLSDNIAKLESNQFGDNPIIYISSYPGHSYTWNGWNLSVEVSPVEEDDSKLHIGTIKDTWTHLGNDLLYRMTALTNFRGTGTAHVIVRTKSNDESGKDGTRYTLDKQEAYFPVGEYRQQTYPYTWDFRPYNINGIKTGDTNGIQYRNIGSSTISNYGGWTHESKLATRKIVDATIQAEYNKKKYNKFIFADGSELTMNQSNNNGATYIREAEGLRVNLNGGLKSTNNYNDASAVTMDGNVLTVNGTITIPEVPQGMFVFVRSVNEPTSVEGAVSRNNKSNNNEEIHSVNVTFLPAQGGDNNTPVNLNNGDIPANVWVYEQTLEGTHDVVITPDGAVEALGVTNYFKPMTKSTKKDRSTWGTDARNERIDYSNTGIFTKHDLKAYTATSYNMPGDEGTLHLEEIKVVPASTGNGHGLVVYDAVKDADPTTVTARPLLPLFVPACNIPNDTPNDEYLKGLVASGQQIAATDNSMSNFTLTDQYYKYNTQTDEKTSDVQVAPDISFYILRIAGEGRANSAYLHIGEAKARMRALYLEFSGLPWEESIDGIENVTISEDEMVKSLNIYSLSGARLNALPTKKGIYIINGKKVYIK